MTLVDVQVTENMQVQQFEARVDGELAGVMEYIPVRGKIVATHTEVARRFEGQGVGSKLVAGALDQLRADGRLVQPMCPYVAAFLRRHPEYADVVDRAGPQH